MWGGFCSFFPGKLISLANEVKFIGKMDITCFWLGCCNTTKSAWLCASVLSNRISEEKKWRNVLKAHWLVTFWCLCSFDTFLYFTKCQVTTAFVFKYILRYRLYALAHPAAYKNCYLIITLTYKCFRCLKSEMSW